MTLRDNASRALQRLTAALRAYPDFIIIGAQKSGTGSLFHYLSQHPQILPSRVKEVHFFDSGLEPDIDAYERGTLWYRAHFPLRGALRSGMITGEASPLYLFHPAAPSRIHANLPDVKLVMILRNPADRAVSHYFHEVRKGREKRPLEQALREEDQLIEAIASTGDFDDLRYRQYSYKARGRYVEQLRRYSDYFRREQLFIAASEKLFSHAAEVLADLFDFLGVESSIEIPDLSPRNIGRNKTAIEPETYSYLRRYFEEPNLALYDFLREDLGW